MTALPGWFSCWLSLLTRRPRPAQIDSARKKAAGVDGIGSGPKLNVKLGTMATKAELFRYRQERTGPKRPKQPSRRRRDRPVDTAQPGVSATDRRAGGKSTGARNVSKSAARKAPYMLEDSVAPARPSRKSTRRGANREKPDVLVPERRDW